MSKSLEELTQQLDLEIQHIPVIQIKPDPDNPNELSDATYATLKQDIRDNGYTQPILVRPVEDGYQLIDGEHRWRVVSELGFATIPAVVWDTDGDDAKLRLITMNRLRGEFVPIKMAHLIVDLSQRIPEDQLRSRLGMSGDELQDHLRNANLSDSVAETLAANESDRLEGKNVSVFCTFDQAAMIEAVLDATAPTKEDRGAALANICHEWAQAQQA